ncbi:MAG: Ku protein, partial [Betaproteobacteria bacterium]|nr:Ku protein [Betaproteobacteria bacterium]
NYHDTYREDLLKRVEAKIRAGDTEEITQPESEEKPPKSAEVVDLMSLLKKSVEAGGRKGAAKEKAANDEEKHPRHRRTARKRSAA